MCAAWYPSLLVVLCFAAPAAPTAIPADVPPCLVQPAWRLSSVMPSLSFLGNVCVSFWNCGRIREFAMKPRHSGFASSAKGTKAISQAPPTRHTDTNRNVHQEESKDRPPRSCVGRCSARARPIALPRGLRTGGGGPDHPRHRSGDGRARPWSEVAGRVGHWRHLHDDDCVTEGGFGCSHAPFCGSATKSVGCGGHCRLASAPFVIQLHGQRCSAVTLGPFVCSLWCAEFSSARFPNATTFHALCWPRPASAFFATGRYPWAAIAHAKLGCCLVSTTIWGAERVFAGLADAGHSA